MILGATNHGLPRATPIPSDHHKQQTPINVSDEAQDVLRLLNLGTEILTH